MTAEGRDQSGGRRLLARVRLLAAVPLAVLGAALGLYVLRCGMSVHPYYLDYYNEAVGGPAYVKHKKW